MAVQFSFTRVRIVPRRLPSGFLEIQLAVDGDSHRLWVKAGNYRYVPDVFEAFSRPITQDKQDLIRCCASDGQERDFSLENAFVPVE